MLGNREHRGEWGVVPDGAKRTYGSRRIEPLPTPHAFWYLALCALIVNSCSSDGRTPLVIYSPHGRDLLTLLERRFEQLRPGVDVRWLDMGSQEVYDRVRSERANPQADVWFGGPATIFARAAADSLLEPYRPSWAAAIEPHGRGPGDRYFGVYETPVAIVYAERALKPEEAPRDWDDLLDPRWRGKILIRDPLASGTMRAVWGMVIERGRKATGDTATLRGRSLNTWGRWRPSCSRRARPTACPRGSMCPLTRCPRGRATCAARWRSRTSIGTCSPSAGPSGCATGMSMSGGRGMGEGGRGRDAVRGVRRCLEALR